MNWKVLSAGEGGEFQIVDENNDYVGRINRARCGSLIESENKINAELIVQAVNSHSEVGKLIQQINQIAWSSEGEESDYLLLRRIARITDKMLENIKSGEHIATGTSSE